MKFGGSSVANAENIGKVVDIVSGELQNNTQVVVVVSALGGITDGLIKLAHLAADHTDYQSDLAELRRKHVNALHALTGNSDSGILNEVFSELESVLQGIYLLGELSPRSLDAIQSFGERMSSIIVVAAMQHRNIEASHVDSRKVIQTNDQFNGARVDLETTYRLVKTSLAKNTISVMGGFIASNAQGITTTLGRGGSDYTAALVGAAMEASEIQIWTDVDGVMTADPRYVASAYALPSISYEEAAELAHFGAKVIHPKTMRPARLKNIPIHIKNTFNPTATGTRIHRVSEADLSEITGISSSDNISLLRMQSTARRITEITARVFQLLHQAHLDVLLTSQASSENALCVGLSHDQAEIAKLLIEEALELEINAGLVSAPRLETGLSIIAVVGERMKGVPGISGRFFDVMGKQGINIKAIAQGSSELNISTVIESRYVKKALNTIHDSFFENEDKKIHVYLVGIGLVGGRLLELIEASIKDHRSQLHLGIKVCGVANSKKMIFSEEGFKLSDVTEKINSGEDMDMDVFIDRMVNTQLANAVFVDCTASGYIPTFYPKIFKKHISIVTANKKGNADLYINYQNLQYLSRKHHVSFLYETNVGAALPIIKTMDQLAHSGDEILEIYGILSGTLSYIFNTFGTSEMSFSEIVKEAQAKGYTEPDPREDLNGMDVLRKVLILGRESGYKMEAEDIEIEPLLNEACMEAPNQDAFFAELRKMDDHFDDLRSQALANQAKWCYMAHFKDGKGSISLQQLTTEHPFYSLQGSDNIVSIRTKRYYESPLVIRGHGAGVDVTAGGVLSDIIDTLRRF